MKNRIGHIGIIGGSGAIANAVLAAALSKVPEAEIISVAEPERANNEFEITNTRYLGGAPILLESIPKQMPYRPQKKISRNVLCPCGSNKKYKRCCGQSSG